jgi:aspartyl protease family protein
LGVFKQRIEVGSPDEQRFETIEALVDTGASYSALPRSFLERLGIIPHRRMTFTIAEAGRVEMDIGRAWIRVDGQMEMSLVGFASDDALPVLGAFTLEALGLAVDPTRKILVPSEAYLLGARQSTTP